jgi:hypothetical protein
MNNTSNLNLQPTIEICNTCAKQLSRCQCIWNAIDLSIKSIHELDNNIKNMEERLIKLENGFLQRIGHLGEALNCLQEGNNKLRTCRIPHKCPVCDGETSIPKKVPAKFTTNNESFILAESCKACDGKGIVWESK